MKTIIVATDFSPAAANATRYAADMALTLQANLLLLHIYQVPIVYQELPMAMTEPSLRQHIDREMLRVQAEVMERTMGRVAVDITTRLGQFFSELDQVCQEVRPYAVVIGSQGTSAIEHLFFGSHAVYAMKHLNWPLVTVPPHISFSAIKKIGLACDFDHLMEVLPVNDIKRMVKEFHAELHILNTAKENDFNPDIVFLSGLLKKLFAPVVPQFHFITSENPDEGIVNFAGEAKIDLLIVLPKPHGMLYQLIHKSNTKQLVLHSHVPVMALHHTPVRGHY
jgi:nucleotide-binding universal stress UspA family protein